MRGFALGILWVGLLSVGPFGAAAGCGGSQDDGAAPIASASAPPAPAASNPPAPVQTIAATPAKRPPHERPIPNFGGVTLDDVKLSTGDLVGRRYVLFVFNPEVDVAAPAAEAAGAISKLRGKQNFEILGVATGSRRATALEFVAKHGLDFPILDDSSARIAQQLRSPVPVLMASVDAEGYVLFTTGWPEGSEIGASVIDSALRDMLHLPAAPAPTHPLLGDKPRAPEVTGTDLEGEAFRLSAQRGRPVLLIFFLHTCPHCHHALRFLEETLPKIPEAQRPKLVGISVQDRAYAVRERMKADGLDFFPILMDPDGSARNAYGANSGVPDLVLVDADGRIVHRSNGWHDVRDPALWRMWLAKVSGAPVPMLLHKTSYSGSEFCGVCHEAEDVTHAFTKHAYAFDTLVRHGASRDPECVSCHVVGFGEEGGYAFDAPSAHLEGVSCESCHGRGGPHLSPARVQNANYEPRCATCHDTKHSLGFDYATFRPKISHTANAGVLGLSLEQKLARIESLGVTRKPLMPTNADHVGSAACQSCHPAEFEIWEAGGHARAGATLASKGEAGKAACLTCHTTGFGADGGFPKGGALSAHTDLGRVGCESCHGAGGEHVPEDAAKIGTILSLGDKCGSCVILQICGTCHDDANDPGFTFEVQEKIDRQRHGTTEPGTSRKKDPKTPAGGGASAGRLPDSAVLGALERAFSGSPAS